MNLDEFLLGGFNLFAKMGQGRLIPALLTHFFGSLPTTSLFFSTQHFFFGPSLDTMEKRLLYSPSECRFNDCHNVRGPWPWNPCNFFFMLIWIVLFVGWIMNWATIQAVVSPVLTTSWWTKSDIKQRKTAKQLTFAGACSCTSEDP